MRKGEAFKGGAGILNKQSARFLFAELFGDGIVGKFELERTARRIVRVTGNEMHQAATDPVPGILARVCAKNSAERAGRDLRVTTMMNPLF